MGVVERAEGESAAACAVFGVPNGSTGEPVADQWRRPRVTAP